MLCNYDGARYVVSIECDGTLAYEYDGSFLPTREEFEYAPDEVLDHLEKICEAIELGGLAEADKLCKVDISTESRMGLLHAEHEWNVWVNIDGISLELG